MGKRTELRQKREQQKRNTLVAFIAGLGLILLAAFVVMSWPKADEAAALKNLSTTPAEVSFSAPQLALENIDSKTEALTDFSNKILLVNNWATWCPPCKAEMPTLVSYYNDHAKDGLMIIAIEAGEPKEQVKKFAAQYQMPFPVWLDPNGKSLDAFKNQNLPNSYVIDRTGTVRLMWTGQINRETLEKYVTPLLKQN